MRLPATLLALASLLTPIARTRIVSPIPEPKDHDPASSMNTYQTSVPLFVEAAGLKLTKSTGPVETFVIDHAEPPTAN